MDKLKSFLVWLSLVLGMAAMTGFIFWLLIDSKIRNTRSGEGFAMACIIFGLLFGTMCWSMITVPKEVTPNVGWRRWRPLMFWVVISLCLEGFFLHMGKHFLFWGDFVPVMLTSAIITFGGWSFGSMRADRARYTIQANRTDFLSSFSE